MAPGSGKMAAVAVDLAKNVLEPLTLFVDFFVLETLGASPFGCHLLLFRVFLPGAIPELVAGGAEPTGGGGGGGGGPGRGV